MALRNIIGNEKLDDIYKVSPQYQLALALKNRVGDNGVSMLTIIANLRVVW